MDCDEFQDVMRAALAIITIVLAAGLSIMLLIIVGWDVKVHVDKISPDPPRCTYVDEKGYGHTALLRPNEVQPSASDAGK